MRTQQVIGTISWSLPSQLSYTPYSFLFPSITVFNPTTTDRRYKIVFRVLSPDGAVIGEYAPYNWFTVAGGSYTTLYPTLWVDRNNVSLVVVLVEETAGEIATLSCTLTSPVIQIVSQVAPAIISIGFLMSMVPVITQEVSEI